MVIHTYSVIIQNQKTMDFFSQYQPLFADAISSNRIGVCKWTESGTTIGTALPELGSLTDDKKEWRAIIVRYVDDSSMDAFESDPCNPYDFAINKDSADTVDESPVPLIRLTQMLGGVPPLEVRFKAEIVREEHKAPKMVYFPIKDSAREQNYKALVNKYRFNGKLPTIILIITVRNKRYQEEENIGRAWLSHKESDSSEFWKRNHFPSICRFMVYDFEAQGPVQKEADDFGFWYSVMLMSINEWDSSTLQAYRLYSLGVVLDRNAMTESFQTLTNRLRDAKHTLEKSIRKDIENQICEEEELPEYCVDVPVVLKLPKSKEYSVKWQSFQFFSRGSASDAAIWSHQRKKAEEELAASIRTAERALDQSADKIRENCSFTEEEVQPLNKYQEEDLLRETNELYHRIVHIQGKLPEENISSDEDVQEAAGNVQKYLLGRVKKEPAVLALVLAAFLIVLCMLPAIIRHFKYGGGSAETLAYIAVGSILLVAVFGTGTLLVQKMKLDSLIRKYNQYLKNKFNQLVERAGDYSIYMSSIASHSRGCSYRNISTQKKNYSNSEHNSKYRHIKAINVLLGKLGIWSKAYHLNVDFSSRRPDVRMEIDTSVSPSENKLYAFEAGTPCLVAVNGSGMTMESPYDFAARIEIVREELYDDE